MKNFNRNKNKLACFIAIATIIITLVAPQGLVALAAEESVEDLFITYNDGLYGSYEEAVAATADITKENIKNEIADGYINDLGEVVDIPKFTSQALAVEFLRRCMVERRTKVEFQLKSSATKKEQRKQEIEKIFKQSLEETPNGNEGDYLRWHYSAVKAYGGSCINGYVKYNFELSYLTDKVAEAKVTKIIEELKTTTFKDWPTRSDYYNTLRVYKWVCEKFSYDYEKERVSHTSYGGLYSDERLAVCQGYATTMYRLLKEMGVPNRIVASKIHAWNIVKIGTRYYNVDATWGDEYSTNGSYDGRFFLVTDENIKFKDKGDKAGTHDRSSNINHMNYTSDAFKKRYPMADTDYKTNGKENNKVSYPNVGVGYKSQRQTYGWEGSSVYNGATSGTVGKSKRLEAIVIKLNNTGKLDLGVEYKTHIQSYGWEANWTKNGNISGTVGQSKRLEAIKIRLTGSDAPMYDIYYRVHAQTYGWLGWAKNGEAAGTAGQSKRLEAIQIKVVKKGTIPSGPIGYSYVEYGKNAQENTVNSGLVNYSTHVQTYGWQNYVSDGSLSGTYGEGKRLEAIKIKLGATGYSGIIQYRTHIQSIGWQSWKQNGALSGTSGKGKRLEAIQIKLTGEMAQKYDVYYRVHAQTYGWLGWAKNGESAGSQGLGKRLEGIQIVLVKKGNGAPSASANKPFIKK